MANLLRGGILYSSLLGRNSQVTNRNNSIGPKEILKNKRSFLYSCKKKKEKQAPMHSTASVVSEVVTVSKKSKSLVWKSGSADSVERVCSTNTDNAAKKNIFVNQNLSLQKPTGVPVVVPHTLDASSSRHHSLAIPHKNTVTTPGVVNDNQIRLNFSAYHSNPRSSSASMIAQKFSISGLNSQKGN
ncbi:unnamed protein product [Phytomonas sp. Hart1]|nr:unnamed protein product [Phytomonas sp. Hart1]|eukprot:CCW66033.1 unnamed protein product [Phytomonas sp. isolate Hart1]